MKEIIILNIMRKIKIERKNAEFIYELFKEKEELGVLYKIFVSNDENDDDFLHFYYSY